MAIAKALKTYLDAHAVKYDLVPHPRTVSSMKTAEAAHVPGDRLAKAVILRDEQGYLMAVVPSTHHLDLSMVHRQLNRRLGLATEQELRELFPDTEVGAVPPVGEAYRVEVILDDALAGQPDIYFEAGDHADLIHVGQQDFQHLLEKADRGRFSHHV
jgi:Ala-tRNA(Pro) deacylase